MSAVALIVAAGEGRRLGAGHKAFVEIAGRTLLERSLAAFDSFSDVDAVVVAAPAGREEDARRIALGSPKVVAVVGGGTTRTGSVRSALASAPDDRAEVIVHDVARPFLTAELLSRVRAPLPEADGAIPVLEVSDTVKRVHDGEVAETLDRSGLVVVQTPQAFRRDALERAHRDAAEAALEATDDAALLESSGFRVVVVRGDPRNLKITVPEDLRVAEALATFADG